MEAEFFKSATAFRRWLERHHADSTELLVGFHKKGSGSPSMTWAEAVDEALCFGWIDGRLNRVDDERFTIRFTPRRPKSRWSARNVERVEALTERGLMQPPGTAAFEVRDRSQQPYSSATRIAEFEPGLLKAFKAKKAAWSFFNAQPPGYRRVATHWVMSPKRPETRERRLATLIEDSAAGRRLGAVTSPGRRAPKRGGSSPRR